MNSVPMNFDATQIDPRQSKGAICFPLGDYPLEIIGVEAVATKDDKNKGMLVLDLKVLDGELRGMIQQDRLNLYGQSETTTRIAYQRLSAYCHVTGRLQLSDANQLIGGRCVCTIGPQEAPNDKYSEVKLVKDLAGNVPVHGQAPAPQNTPIQAQAPVQTQQAQQPAQAASASPWNNPAAPAQQPTQQQPAQSQPWQQQPAAAAAPAGNKPPWAN